MPVEFSHDKPLDIVNNVEIYNALTLPTMGLIEQPQILRGHNVPLLIMHVPLAIS